ncbi:MAG: hypothetical protein IT536_21590 [Hyphomicrobiales bacterium]|nr:hypothetical protein [Hyphomicrobiales bacterium]
MHERPRAAGRGMTTRPRVSRLAVGVTAALLAAGFGLTIMVFDPGYMTIDAGWVYRAISEGLGDWQSPVMSLIWQAIDPIAPGSRSMLLLLALLYWTGFGIVAFTAARQAGWLGPLTIVLALTPPAFVLVGMIWRDVLFADLWLCAAALTYASRDWRSALRWPIAALAILLVAIGLLLRPNAIVAAPVLAGYVLWPTAFHWKRIAAILIPGAIAGYALIHTVYYTLLDAERQYPLHSVLVFDLGGITYFSGENRFPLAFTPEQTAMLFTRDCYNPTRWDYYWHIAPCDFVMQRLERKDDKVFGTPRLVEAWRNAMLAEPFAYLKHRATFMRTFLVEPSLVLPVLELPHPSRQVHADNRLFMMLVAVHDALQETWLLRVGVWLAAALAVMLLAWPLRATPHGAFALGVCGSGALYVLSYSVFGVAAEYRYAYWCVVASLVGAVALAVGRSAAKPSGSA